MKRMFLVLSMFFIYHMTSAQQNPAVVDSFKAQLSRAKTSEEKVEILGPLSMTLMNTNLSEADRYGALMMQEAELSRKRNLMVKALYYNGLRYSFFVQNKEFIQKAIDYLNKGLTLARQNRLDKESAEGYLYLSTVYTRVPDLDKSLSYTTQAFAIVQTIRDDSLEAATHISYGNVYQLKKERILALRYYLNALRIAEETKKEQSKTLRHDLLRNCYANLSAFYADLKEYDRAIDYSKNAMEELPFTSAPNKEYQEVVDVYNLGNLYVAKKNFDMAIYYFERSIKMADSVKYPPLKMPGYNGLLNQYIISKQPEKALEFFNTRAELKQFINNFGFSHVIDDAYGVIYTQIGKYDTAEYYFTKAAPGFEAKSTPAGKLNFYAHNGELYDKWGKTPKAIEYFLRAKSLADQISNLEWQQNISKELDSLFAKAGDYKQSHFYNTQYIQYKDSLQKLGEQKDLLQMEIADEARRDELRKQEQEEALRKRHNVQYMGITVAIAVVFLLLILMGAFKVSETTIKIMGFFAFIFLFEFIILIADSKIHHMTHGEPLPILAIKIVLIAMLLPLHHWLEHKVVTYLASKKLIIPNRKSIWNNLVKRKPVEH